MPYCPKCRFEYNLEITRCPDCDVELVEQLFEEEVEYSDERSLEEAGWVPIGILTANSYAEMVAEGLRDNGIEAEVIAQAGYFGISGMMGDGSYAPGGSGYVILVPTAQVEAANEIAELLLGDIWVKSRLTKPPKIGQ